MSDRAIKNKVIHATKWSLVTEVIAKIIVPINNMILARILLPEAFGVIATVTMITSFADMFTDAGFQKFLVQHDFKNGKEQDQYANVAFWTNFGISISFLLVIALFSDNIATGVGNPGLGYVIVISCLQLPLTSFSSIQMALYRRQFDFKTLFYVRLIGSLIPFIVSIPLALLGFNYWALIIGYLLVHLSNAILLTYKATWKPSFYYDYEKLKNMFSFSAWSLLESILVWFGTWIDIFLISQAFSQYYLGIYKTSITMVNAIMSLITASTLPIIFSALSRLKNDKEQFKNAYLKFQRILSMIIFPLGIGVFIYRDFVTKILLGDNWMEGSMIIGLWALLSGFVIVFNNINTEAYRAYGKFKLTVLSQFLYIVVLIPTLQVSVLFGFWAMVYLRSIVRIESILVHFMLMKRAIGISAWKSIQNIFPTLLVSILMGIFAYLLKQLSSGMTWDLITILISSVFYVGILSTFPHIKDEMKYIVSKFMKVDKPLHKEEPIA